jgi:hypothetical protein
LARRPEMVEQARQAFPEMEATPEAEVERVAVTVQATTRADTLAATVEETAAVPDQAQMRTQVRLVMAATTTRPEGSVSSRDWVSD